MKKILLLLLLPAFCFSQTKLTIKSYTYDDCRLLFKCNDSLYFKKTLKNDTIFKVPFLNVQSPTNGVANINAYGSFEDAVLQFNQQNAQGISLQIGGLAVSGVGLALALLGSNSDKNSSAYVGAALVAVGACINIGGLVIESKSHRHLTRYEQMKKSVAYK